MSDVLSQDKVNVDKVFDSSKNNHTLTPSETIYRISYKNINTIKFASPQNIKTILFDSNLTCNLHCIYCHNHRTNETVKESDFLNFIENQIGSVDNFQIGCAMEPTMDKRMTKFALMVSNSKANPRKNFRLQTNGILLHKHNIEELKEAGVNRITMSIDTINPEIHKEMRGGSDLEKILKNISDVRKKWKEAPVEFITTVYKKNIDLLDDLCKYAVDNDIKQMELRKMFYFPNSKIIKEHDKMKSLMLDDSEFLEKTKVLQEKYKKKIKFFILGTDQHEHHKKVEKVSI